MLMHMIISRAVSSCKVILAILNTLCLAVLGETAISLISPLRHCHSGANFQIRYLSRENGLHLIYWVRLVAMGSSAVSTS